MQRILNCLKLAPMAFSTNERRIPFFAIGSTIIAVSIDAEKIYIGFLYQQAVPVSVCRKLVAENIGA